MKLKSLFLMIGILFLAVSGAFAQSDELPLLAKTDILTIAHPQGWQVRVAQGDVIAENDATEIRFDVYNKALYTEAKVTDGDLAGALGYWFTPRDETIAFDATRLSRQTIGVYEALVYDYVDSANGDSYERSIVAFTLPNENVVFASAVPKVGYALSERPLFLQIVASASLPDISFVTLRDGAIVGVLDNWRIVSRTSEKFVIEDDNTQVTFTWRLRKDVQSNRINSLKKLLEFHLQTTLEDSALTRTTYSGMRAITHRNETTLYVALFLKNGSGVVVEIAPQAGKTANETDALKMVNNITAVAPRVVPLSTGAP